MNIRLKLTLLLLMLFLLPASLFAQRKKVGVVLSGGGAKGVAHITALKVIEEAGIPIDFIAGTSMGAIVGGLYAIGYDTETLDSMVRTQNWTELLSDRVSRRNLSFGAKENDEKYILTVSLTDNNRFQIPTGLVGGYNVYNLLYELTIGYNDSISFHSLPIPFSCVAFDMVSGESIVQDCGYLPEAIRASMSIPGAFEPVRKDGMVLIDGGITNNFPADVVKAMGAEIIIGIDVGAGIRTEEELNTLPDMFNQLTNFTGLEALKRNKKLVDLYIKPDIVPYSAASFSPEAIDTLLNRGMVAAYGKWDELIELKAKIGIAEDYEPLPLPYNDPDKLIMIGSVSLDGLTTESEKVLRRIMGIKDNSLITTSELQRAVSRLQGTESLTDVHYFLTGNSPYDVTFVVREKPRSSIGIGFRFDSEEMAAILLNVRLSGRNMGNSHFDLTGRLGNNPYGKLTYVLGNETERQFSLSYMYRYNDLNQYYKGDKVSNLDFTHHEIDLNFSNIKLRNLMAGAGIRYDYYHFHSILARNGRETVIRSQGLVNYYANINFETLDSRNYPTRGSYFSARYTLSTTNFITYRGHAPFSAIQAYYHTALSINKRVTFIPGLFGRVLIGSEVAYPSLNFLGGTNGGRYLPQQIPFIGIRHFEKFDNSVMGARLDVRGRIGKKHYIFSKSNYALAADDFFDLFDGESVFGTGLGYSYNSIVGPVEVMFDWSTRSRSLGFYFSMGFYF